MRIKYVAVTLVRWQEYWRSRLRPAQTELESIATRCGECGQT